MPCDVVFCDDCLWDDSTSYHSFCLAPKPFTYRDITNIEFIEKEELIKLVKSTEDRVLTFPDGS